MVISPKRLKQKISARLPLLESWEPVSCMLELNSASLARCMIFFDHSSLSKYSL